MRLATTLAVAITHKHTNQRAEFSKSDLLLQFCPPLILRLPAEKLNFVLLLGAAAKPCIFSGPGQDTGAAERSWGGWDQGRGHEWGPQRPPVTGCGGDTRGRRERGPGRCGQQRGSLPLSSLLPPYLRIHRCGFQECNYQSGCELLTNLPGTVGEGAAPGPGHRGAPTGREGGGAALGTGTGHGLRTPGGACRGLPETPPQPPGALCRLPPAPHKPRGAPWPPPRGPPPPQRGSARRGPKLGSREGG